jgi:hypothetical protein
MSQDDRDQNFEQALARHLRSGHSGSVPDQAVQVGYTDGLPAPGSHCPDAALIAAFHERTLSPNEFTGVQQHIATCPRCEAFLDVLKSTDAVEFHAQDETVTKPRASVLSTGARYVDYVSGPSKVIAVPSGQPQPFDIPQDISTARRRIVRWVAPAGAIAAGLLIWFAVRQNTQTYVNKSEQIQVANRQPADQSLLEEPSAAASATLQTDSNSKASPPPRNPQALSHAPAPLAPTPGAPANKPSAAFPAASSETVIVESSPSSPSEPRQSSGNVAVSSNGEVAATADRKDRSSSENVEVSASSQTVTVESAPTNAVLPSQLPTTSASAAKQNAATDIKKESATNPPPAASVQDLAMYGRAVSSLQTLNPVVRTVAAPGGNVLWRVSGNGKIERSADRGVTWIPQDAGNTQELVSGSAPDDQVFWVAGHQTIFRTTDGGAHWAKLASPAATEVGGIVAVDALRATLTDAKGHATFTTTDGGLTWTEAKK